MRLSLEFTKASGAGNDFVILNNTAGSLQADFSRLAIALCSRHFGVGADGLLIIEPSTCADFMMRYYNADGTSGGMCGNGGRCAARFASLHNIAGIHQTFEACGHVYTAEILPTGVRLHMKEPIELRENILLHIEDTTLMATAINTGAPHVVIPVEDVQSLDVARLGRLIRFNEEFKPEGTNVNFVRHIAQNEIELRTYERGVEAETLACGTGSVAGALVSQLRFGLRSPVTVRARSGERLRVQFTVAGNKFMDIILEGSAHILFTGNLEYDPLTNQITT